MIIITIKLTDDGKSVKASAQAVPDAHVTDEEHLGGSFESPDRN